MTVSQISQEGGRALGSCREHVAKPQGSQAPQRVAPGHLGLVEKPLHSSEELGERNIHKSREGPHVFRTEQSLGQEAGDVLRSSKTERAKRIRAPTETSFIPVRSTGVQSGECNGTQKEANRQY